jgi:hypothetical protein
VNEKLENIIIKYLNKLYGDLEEYRTDKHPDSIFFVKNKKVYLEHHLENALLYVNYDTIWFDLKNTFSLNYGEIQSIIDKWVEVDYNLKGVIPYNYNSDANYRWKFLTI